MPCGAFERRFEQALCRTPRARVVLQPRDRFGCAGIAMLDRTRIGNL
jgi:hypothetical protein